MIDFKRLHELEKEVQDTHDKICNQVWLVHHIIGRDFKSDEYVLLNIDRVLMKRPIFVVIISHGHDRTANNKAFFSAVYIKKKLFEMTEEELIENQERLSKELKETNQKQLLEKVLNHDGR